MKSTKCHVKQSGFYLHSGKPAELGSGMSFRKMILAAMAHGSRDKEEVLTEKAATENFNQSYEYKVKEQTKEVSEVKWREAQ